MKPVTILLFLLPRVALADREIAVEPVCAEIESPGILDDAGGVAARDLLVRSLENENQLVVLTGCTKTFRVGHTVQNGVLTVRIAGPHGTRRWTNATPERLPEIYRDMVRNLLTPPVSPVVATPEAPPIPEMPLAKRFEETSPPPAAFVPGSAPPAPFGVPGISNAPPAPFPAPITDFGRNHDEPAGGWHVQLGVGGAGGLGSGVSLEVGYRKRIDSYAIDAFGAVLDGEAGGTSKLGFEVLSIKALQDSKVFGGGGISLGRTELSDTMFGGTASSGGGLGIELTAGVSFSKLFLQADLSLPAYTTSVAYPASLSVSLGYGRM